MSKTLGIIGGMGPLATVNLFNKIVLNTDAQNDQEHIHILIDSNTNIPDRTAFLLGKGKDPTEELIKSAIRLEKAGADFLIMPCNTAHYFYETIKEKINIDFLNLIEETAKYVQSNYPNIKKIGLLSTDGTLKAKIYDLYFNRQNIQVISPEREMQNSIMEIIYGIKAGKKEIQIDAIYNTIEELKTKGAEVFILGCTELSIINEMFNLEKNLADVKNAGDAVHIVDAVNVIVEKAIGFAGKKVLK
ncbi:MAG: aspartate/glutamate racemase family protein [Candidatus Alkaliphilus sp. MAG34]